MIGGATTSRKHTAVKIEEKYTSSVIHVIDASRCVGIVSKLLNPDHKNELVKKTKNEYETIRETFYQNHQKLKLLPINEARNRKPNLVYNPVQPQKIEIQKIELISLYIEEPTDYQFWAGDINADTTLNDLDVVQLVDLILILNP